MSNPSSTSSAPTSDYCLDFALPEDTLPSLAEEIARHGDHLRMRSTREGHWAYLLNTAEAAEHVLGPGYRRYRKGMGIDRVNILLGRGLMVSEGDFWKNQRRMIQPAFRRRALDAFVRRAVECSEDLAGEWRETKAVDLTDAMSRITLKFILVALFSDDLQSLTDESGESLFALVNDESARDLQFARQFRALAKPLSSLIAKRRKRDASRDDLLALLMAARDREDQPMPDRQIVDEVLTLIIAGHETTAAALTWTWLLISQHPAVEAKLHDEVDSVSLDTSATLESLGTLPYTRQVVDESLRLYPPGWMLARRALEDDQIGDTFIEAGSDVLVSPYLLHRNARYWPDAESFDPERFSPEIQTRRPKYSYVPFSAGARNCIGEHVALAEMTVHVALIARRYRLTRASGIPVSMEAQINLRPKGELPMTVVPRD